MQIIHLDAEKRKMILTHKPTLLKSELPLITSYEEAQEGVVSHGWISGVRVRIRYPVYVCICVCIVCVYCLCALAWLRANHRAPHKHRR